MYKDSKAKPKITKIHLASFIVFMLFLYPPIFDKTSYLPAGNLLIMMSMGFMVLRLVSIGIVFIYTYYIKKNIFVLKYLVPILFFCGIYLIQIISTIIYSGRVQHIILAFFNMLVPIIWVVVNRVYYYEIISALRVYMYCLIIVNFVMILLFPNGYFVTVNMWESTDAQWFLGLGNTMSPYIILTIMLAIFSISEKKPWISKIKDVVIVGMCVVTAFLVECATLIMGISIMLILVVFTCLIKNKKNNPINLLMIIAFVIVIIFVLLRNINLFAFIIEQFLKRDLTLTSRLRIWDSSIQYILQRPIFGYGVCDFSYLQRILLASHQHNNYLHILFQGGIASMIFFLLLLNCCRKELNKSTSRCSIIVAITIFTFLIIFISEVYSEGTYILPFYLVLTISLLQKKQHE